MSGSSDSSGSTIYAMIPNPNSETLTRLPAKTTVQTESSINIPLHPRQTIPSISSLSATSGQSNGSIPTSSLGKSLNCLTSQSLTNLPSCGSEPPNISSSNFYQASLRTSNPFKPDPKSILRCSRHDLNALRKESECLLTQIPKPFHRGHNDDSTGATIFDLKFEDRQRVAALIRDLANAHEQLEILESRLAAEGDRFQKEYQKQVDFVKELSTRCQVLSEALKQGQASVLQKELDGFRRENQELRSTIAAMESTNATLKESYNSLEKKYTKSTEDNKRLKWILKTIQQREEILLQNKCHTEEKFHMPHNETESPSNIVILKEGRNESISSSQVPHGMHENKGSTDFSTYAKESQQTVQSGGDYQEFQVYEPHLVIPPMTTPVIMKIPRSPLVGGQSSLRPQVTHSEPYQRQVKPDNRAVNQTRSNPEDIRTTQLDPHEEEILRELFFTF